MFLFGNREENGRGRGRTRVDGGERRGTQKKKETLNQREIEREKNYGTTL